MSVIKFNSPHGSHGFLSNYYLNSFYSRTFNVDAKSVQHLLQAAKFWWGVKIGDRNVFDLVLSANTCADAKIAADSFSHKCNHSWNHTLRNTSPFFCHVISRIPEFRNETMETYIMYRIVREKFQDPTLRQLLLNTGDAEIVFDSANDRVYGKVNGVGRNLLGLMLSYIRHEIAFLPPQYHFTRETVAAPARTPSAAIVHQPIVATPAPIPQFVPRSNQVLGNNRDEEINTLKTANTLMMVIIIILVLFVLKLIR
jgi:predicted NAD-dependent protein-ADP-ribosyltransferase YbiA (DUF1768 family)